ncbi:MAG: hypothetical protein ACYCST_22025 [Acidimicrobiales bacterium]
MSFQQGNQNIHQYDAKIPTHTFKIARANLPRERLRVLENFKPNILTSNQDIFNLLISQPDIFDPLNQICVLDLLHCLITVYLKLSTPQNKNPDPELLQTFFKLLNEQLTDLKTGLCPQGRTIRLIQILQVYEGLALNP